MLLWIIAILLGALLALLGLGAICACMLSSRISREEEDARAKEFVETRERGYDLSPAELIEKR